MKRLRIIEGKLNPIARRLQRVTAAAGGEVGDSAEEGMVTGAGTGILRKLAAPDWAAVRMRAGAIPRTRVARAEKARAAPTATPILGAGDWGAFAAGG
jgi:hypothetical protein